MKRKLATRKHFTVIQVLSTFLFQQKCLNRTQYFGLIIFGLGLLFVALHSYQTLLQAAGFKLLDKLSISFEVLRVVELTLSMLSIGSITVILFLIIVKRIRDCNKSVWWLFVMLIPKVGAYFLLALLSIFPTSSNVSAYEKKSKPPGKY